MGVPREDIILGLQPPYKRQYTDYGVAWNVQLKKQNTQIPNFLKKSGI
jgi:hypothetical protein